MAPIWAFLQSLLQFADSLCQSIMQIVSLLCRSCLVQCLQFQKHSACGPSWPDLLHLTQSASATSQYEKHSSPTHKVSTPRMGNVQHICKEMADAISSPNRTTGSASKAQITQSLQTLQLQGTTIDRSMISVRCIWIALKSGNRNMI